MGRGGMINSSVSSLSFIFFILHCPSLSSPLLSLLSLFSLSLGDDAKWPTRVDVSLNPQHNQSIKVFFYIQNNIVNLFSCFSMNWINYILNVIRSSVRKVTLRKHAYSNKLKILPPKNENFQIKKSDSFHISAQNIDRGHSLESPRQGGSNEYPQSMFLSRNNKNNVYPCKPQFYYI